MIHLTTSATEEDIHRIYDLRASSFISKPVTFADLIWTMETLTEQWL